VSKNAGKKLHQIHDAEGERALRQFVDLPAHRHTHHRGERGKKPRDEEISEIAVLKDSKGGRTVAHQRQKIDGAATVANIK